MKTLAIWILAVLSAQCARTEKRPPEIIAKSDAVQAVGGGCETCELMYVGMPEYIDAIDTSAGWPDGRKLVVKGTVFKADGKTPAPGIILYYWQTDHDGLYDAKTGMPQNAKRHGHIRGWMKTAADGTYALYTSRPAAYPGTRNPEHIHVVVKEPDVNEYYIDELVFDDDPFLTAEIRKRHENRGGSGILKPVGSGVATAVHNIYLGRNIPNYPE